MIGHEEVKTDLGIQEVSSLAKMIWEQHYTPIIGGAQVRYMLEHLQSIEAIKIQIQEKNYVYYLLKEDEKNVGYIGIQLQKDSIFLSKLYIKEEFRKKGIATYAFQFVEQYAKENKLRKIWLTVNRHNTHTIAIYLKKGFVRVREEQADIGGGYIMDDYIMEKSL